MTPPDLLWAAVAAALCAAAAVLCAWILRGAGLSGGRPAAAVVGGVMGGLLLGGAVLGRIAPGWHEHIYLGGVQERAALRAAVREDRLELAGMRAAGLAAEAIDHTQSEQRAARAPLRAALNAAVSARMDAHRAAAMVLLAAAAFAGGAASRRPRRSRARANPWAAAPLFTAIPAAATFVLLRLLASVDAPTALAAAGATGIGSMLLSPARWTPAVGRQTGVWAVTTISLLFGAAIILLAGVWAWAQGQATTFMPMAAGLAVVLAWCAGGLARLCPCVGTRSGRLAKGAFLAALAPAAISLAAVHLDIHLLANGNVGGWTVIACLILATIAASDGRWVGAYVGWMALPRARPRGLLVNAATEALGTGVLLTQAVGAGWLFSMGFFARGDAADAVALACVLAGPLLAEPLIGVYRVAAAKLADTRP